jgi:hypothetical protein
MSPDPWTAFLDWLTTVLVPSWGELIGLLPYVLVIGVLGPILTLLALGWAWHLLTRQRARVRRRAAEAVPAPLDAHGLPVFPVNTPYCVEHALIHPPRARTCEVDRADLLVTCPTDGTVRAAEVQTCATCGTSYRLGATAPALLVVGSDGPPEGGAAVA